MCLCYSEGRDMFISTDFLFQHCSTPVAAGLCVVFRFVKHREGRLKEKKNTKNSTLALEIALLSLSSQMSEVHC